MTVFVSMNLSKFMRKYFVQKQILLGQMNTQVEEMVTGFKTVIAYGKEQDACEEFAKISEEFRKCSIRANVWGGLMGPANNIINNLNYLIVAATGVFFTMKGAISVGDVQAILQYSRQLSMPINQIANQYASILTAIAGAERVFKVMDTEPEPEDKVTASTPEIKGHVVLENVTFGYTPEKTVLKNVSLYAKPGQKIAFVGSTGAGKTTVTNLLNRFYDIQIVQKTMTANDIRDYKRDELRQNIAMVFQDNNLGKIIGEPSSNKPESYGDCLYFQLPTSKLHLSISFKKWYRIDQSKKDLLIEPDIPCDEQKAVSVLYDLI
jgi:ATP-binding cassette subfamily B protein